MEVLLVLLPKCLSTYLLNIFYWCSVVSQSFPDFIVLFNCWRGYRKLFTPQETTCWKVFLVIYRDFVSFGVLRWVPPARCHWFCLFSRCLIPESWYSELVRLHLTGECGRSHQVAFCGVWPKLQRLS